MPTIVLVKRKRGYAVDAARYIPRKQTYVTLNTSVLMEKSNLSTKDHLTKQLPDRRAPRRGLSQRLRAWYLRGSEALTEASRGSDS